MSCHGLRQFAICYMKMQSDLVGGGGGGRGVTASYRGSTTFTIFPKLYDYFRRKDLCLHNAGIPITASLTQSSFCKPDVHLNSLIISLTLSRNFNIYIFINVLCYFSRVLDGRICFYIKTFNFMPVFKAKLKTFLKDFD